MTDASKTRNRIVLLAEDNSDDVLLFKRACKYVGITNPVRVVKDGQQAIEYLEGSGKFAQRGRYPFPVLLALDLVMPRKTGFEVIEWARQQVTLKDLPIIVFARSGDLSEVKRAYGLGANSFIVKSLDYQEFAGQLKDIRTHWLSATA